MAEVLVYVDRHGRVRARLDVSDRTRIYTVPRESAVECMADVTAWIESYLDTDWPEDSKEP